MQTLKEEEGGETVNGRIVCRAALGCHRNKAKHLRPRTYHNEQWRYGRSAQRMTSFVTVDWTFSGVQ